MYEALSGREKQMSDEHKKRIEKESSQTKINYETLYVPCFSLNTILKAIDVNKVDYFSLDIEGGEYDVISSLSYDKIDIRTFSIEHNGETERKNLIIDHLERNNFKLTKEDKQDVYFSKY
jgi:hypothetical protein